MNKFTPTKRHIRFTKPKTKDFWDLKLNTMTCSSVKLSRNKIAKEKKVVKRLKWRNCRKEDNKLWRISGGWNIVSKKGIEIFQLMISFSLNTISSEKVSNLKMRQNMKSSLDTWERKMTKEDWHPSTNQRTTKLTRFWECWRSQKEQWLRERCQMKSDCIQNRILAIISALHQMVYHLYLCIYACEHLLRVRVHLSVHFICQDLHLVKFLIERPFFFQDWFHFLHLSNLRILQFFFLCFSLDSHLGEIIFIFLRGFRMKFNNLTLPSLDMANWGMDFPHIIISNLHDFKLTFGFWSWVRWVFDFIYFCFWFDILLFNRLQLWAFPICIVHLSYIVCILSFL